MHQLRSMGRPKNPNKQQPGFLVRLPDEVRAPLEARSAHTGRTLTTELLIAVVKHLAAEPEAGPMLRLPTDLPTGHTPPGNVSPPKKSPRPKKSPPAKPAG